MKAIVQKVLHHKGNRVSEFQTDEAAINDLERCFKQMRTEAILLVLDDAWSGSESLLQKLGFQLPDYKILVTSRSEFPQFGPAHYLKPLTDEAARTLFLHSASLQDGNSYIPDENIVSKVLCLSPVICYYSFYFSPLYMKCAHVFFFLTFQIWFYPTADIESL